MIKVFTLVLFIFTLIAFSPSKSKDRKVRGDKIFETDQVHEIRIRFLQCSAWDSLFYYKQLKDSLDRSVYMQGNVSINGKTYFGVGIRLKGESSFDFYPGRKKSFKINFGKFNKKQKWSGVKTINLNNAFKDPTFMREKLYLDFMRKEGLAVPRCTYANLYVNGEHLGLYLLVEEIDKSFLKQNFGNKSGNLYKGDPKPYLEYLGPDTLAYLYKYQVKKNANKSLDDLMQFIRYINNVEEGFSQDPALLKDHLNTEACLKIWAITNLFNNVDAYNLLFAHNFYLYHNVESNRFEWIPYDGNYAFCAWSPIFTLEQAENLSLLFRYDRYPNPLVHRFFDTPAYREFYLNYTRQLLKENFSEDYISHQVDSLALKIRRYVYQDKQKMYSNDDFERNLKSVIGDEQDPGAFVPGLKDFTRKRIQAVKRELKKLDKLF